MSDSEQYDDEYHFEDSDALMPDSEENKDSTLIDEPKFSSTIKKTIVENTIFRNALLTLMFVALLAIFYKFSDYFITSKKTTDEISAVSPTKTQAEIRKATIMSRRQLIAPAPKPMVVESNVSHLTDEKLQVVEQNQETLNVDVAEVKSQMVVVSDKVNAMMTKITDLNRLIEQLSETVREQSAVIGRLTARQAAPPRTVHSMYNKPVPVGPKYYVQAVIPGRAWLIATNGTTLTVREGTMIAGYGIVKLIDATQGRVMTSSGRMIRFSQDDS